MFGFLKINNITCAENNYSIPNIGAKFLCDMEKADDIGVYCDYALIIPMIALDQL